VFGETVRAHRRRLGMSQEDLSGKARIGVRTIRDIEAGRSGTPRPATLRLLAEAFGLHGTDRDRFHELAHHHAKSEATAGTTKVVDSISGVEDVPHQVREDRAATDRRETAPAEDSSLGQVSAEAIHMARSGIKLLASRGEAPAVTEAIDIADHRRRAVSMPGVAHGGRLSFEAAARLYVPTLTMRLAHGARNGALWVSLISIPAVVLALYLLATGETGQSIATILAVPLVIHAIAVAVIMSRRPSSLAAPATGGSRRFMIGAAAVVLGAVLPGAIWWGISRYSDLDVELGSSFQLADGRSHLVEATNAEGMWEGRLVFTPRLVSNSVANDCVLPAWLIIAPVADGQIRESKMVRHGERVSLSIPASTGQVRVRIEYADPGKQGCVVTVTLSGAALER